MLSTYEDLVNACLATGERHHLLYVYMKIASTPSGEDMQALFPGQDVNGIESICTILFDAHEPVKPGLTFDQMVANADSHYPDWDVVFILTAKNEDGSAVSDERAKSFLEQMHDSILSGEFPAGAPIFDKQGNLKGLDKSMPIRVHDPTTRVN